MSKPPSFDRLEALLRRAAAEARADLPGRRLDALPPTPRRTSAAAARPTLLQKLAAVFGAGRADSAEAVAERLTRSAQGRPIAELYEPAVTSDAPLAQELPKEGAA